MDESLKPKFNKTVAGAVAGTVIVVTCFGHEAKEQFLDTAHPVAGARHRREHERIDGNCVQRIDNISRTADAGAGLSRETSLQQRSSSVGCPRA